LAAYERCLQLAPARLGCHGQKALAFVVMGRVDEARALFGGQAPRFFSCNWGTLADCEPYDLPDPSFNGVLAIGLGDFDAAFDWANKAAERPFGFVTQTRWQAFWTPPEYRADPRYQRLLDRLGLTDAWQAELCQRARGLTPVTGIAVRCARA
jgi:hypothetical protein